MSNPTDTPAVELTEFDKRLGNMIIVAAHHHFTNPLRTGWALWWNRLRRPGAEAAAHAAWERFELLTVVQAMYCGVFDYDGQRAHTVRVRSDLHQVYRRGVANVLLERAEEAHR